MHRPLPLLALALILAGCSTPPQDPEQRRQAENLRREQALEKSEQAQREREQESLRRRFARYSTTELKVMSAAYGGALEASEHADLVNDLRTRIWGTTAKHNVKMLIDVERELLRRWKAGDEEAKLPKFDAVGTREGPK